MIATVKPVFATLRVLAAKVDRAALNACVNLQKLRQAYTFLAMACCFLELRLSEFVVQLRKRSVDTTGCYMTVVIMIKPVKNCLGIIFLGRTDICLSGSKN